MPKYIPYYDENTGLKRGVMPNHKDICARQQLMKEIGFIVDAEIWIKDYGYVPVYVFARELSHAECQVLCLTKI